MIDDPDPGWPWTWWVLVGFVAPPFIEKRRRRGNGLVEIRQMVVGYIIGFPIFGLVVLGLAIGNHRTANHSAGVLFLALAVGIRSGLARRAEKPLDLGSPATLVESWRNRYFIRVAASNFAGILGFIGYLVTGAVWVFPACAAVGILGFVQLAPTKRNLEADQRAITAAGSDLSLARSLSTTATISA